MSPQTRESDTGLIRAIGKGDNAALEQLYERHSSRLLNYLIGQVRDRSQAEELLQSIMLAVWKAAPKFRGDSRATTWLMAITRYHAIHAHRQRKPASLPLPENQADYKTGPMEAMLRQSERAEVNAALRKLPAEQRQTLELVFYQDLSDQEAAHLMGVSVGTVKSRLHRAKAALKRLLSKN